MMHHLGPHEAQAVRLATLAICAGLGRAEIALEEIRARRAARRGSPLASELLLGRVGALEDQLDEIERVEREL